MNMERTLGRPRRSTGEVQERGRFRIGVGDLVVGRRNGHRFGPVHGALEGLGLLRIGDGDNVLERGNAFADRCDSTPVQSLGRQKNARLAQLKPLDDGLRTKRGEQRAEHRLVLQRSERAEVELGNSPSKRVHSVAGFDAKCSQDVGKLIAARIELGITQLLALAFLAEPDDRSLLPVPVRYVPADGLVG